MIMKLRHYLSMAAIIAAAGTLTSNAQNVYANYQGIPIDGTVFTVADFGLNPDSHPKSAKITKQYEDFMGRGYDKDIQTVEFDDNGRLTSFTYDGATYAPLRVVYTYGPDGNLSEMDVFEQLVTMVDNPTPLVNKHYTYNWDNGKVSYITETINVDKGLNYKGNPTQLNVTYGANGKVSSAVCKQSPRVKFNFDSNGKKTDGRSFQCDGYNNGYPYGSDYDKMDDVFRKVNLTRNIPLHWSNMDDDPNLIYGKPFEFDINSAAVTRDDKGNWTEAKFSGGEFPDIYTMEIVY